MDVYHGHSSGPLFAQNPANIKPENYVVPLYATPAVHNLGAVGRHPYAHHSQNRRRTASSTEECAYKMPLQKRQRSGEPTGPPPVKQVKSEHPEEFSKQVKKKLQSSTRTGQACDRCKIRKIRCDGLPGGCSPCLQNNIECNTTDRITGRATSRGYVEALEQHNRDLESRVRELEAQLGQVGAVDVRPTNGYSDIGASGYNSYTQGPAWTASQTRDGSSMPNNQAQETNIFRALPTFRAGCIGDNYLGVATGNSRLSSIKGTALTILGMEINIADFRSLDMDEPDSIGIHSPLYNKSYQAFLQSALGVNPNIERVELPGRAEGLTYASWYFRVVNPYMPIMHKPTFMNLLTRTYDDETFKPTPAETVMVNMVFAIMYFQYAARNVEDPPQQERLNQLSNRFYHASIQKFYALVCSHTVQDVQALTLICAHLRNFAKPGASWMLTQITMSLAVELGLHRSAKRWAEDAMPNPIDIEVRKRTFYALLTIHITLSGKLGRPMPFRVEDFDVEFPEAYDDNLLTEAGYDTSKPGKCEFEIGTYALPLALLYMELYSTIYAVRRMSTECYISTIERLESRLRSWQEGLPRHLLRGEVADDDQEGRVFALYAENWALEFRLLLRHPAVSLTNDPEFNAESMRICVESSRKMLGVVRQLQKLKSLDTTWYSSAVYALGITTTLFSQWEKREGTSAADLAALREEMDLWLDIMGDVGALTGSGNRLREAVRNVTDGTLSLLSKRLPVRNGSYSQASKGGRLSKSPTQQDTYPPQQPFSYAGHPQTNGNPPPSTNYPQVPPHLGPQQTPYPPATQYSQYSSESSAAIGYPTPTGDAQQNYGQYPVSTDVNETPLLAAFSPHVSQPPTQPNAWQRPPQVNSGSNSWQQWTNTIAGNLEPQECYSASALMSLGGRDMTEGSTHPPTTVGMPNMGSHVQSGIMDQGVAQIWPLSLFDMNHNGANS